MAGVSYQPGEETEVSQRGPSHGTCPLTGHPSARGRGARAVRVSAGGADPRPQDAGS